MQSELDSSMQSSSAHAQSLQASLAGLQKDREQLQAELQQARSALESRASEHEYLQSEASSLQQALRKQVQETQQAQQACDGWMSKARQQVCPRQKFLVSTVRSYICLSFQLTTWCFTSMNSEGMHQGYACSKYLHHCECADLHCQTYAQ